MRDEHVRHGLHVGDEMAARSTPPFVDSAEDQPFLLRAEAFQLLEAAGSRSRFELVDGQNVQRVMEQGHRLRTQPLEMQQVEE